MTIKECYDLFGGDYEEARTRLISDKMIEKFLHKFFNDQTFDELTVQIEQKNADGAFRAAHSLKGVAGNMAFKNLTEDVNVLTEMLRNQNSVGNDVQKQFLHAQKNYQLIIESLNKLFT